MIAFIQAHWHAFWALPASCFILAVILVVIHKRRARTMPLYEIGSDNRLQRAPKASDEAWRRK